MNTNEKPLTESDFRTGHNPCFTSDIKSAALNVYADDMHNYLLPYAQLLSAERFSNPALEQEPDAPPEKMLIRFAQAVVAVLGSGLGAVERDLQQYELKFVKSAPRRFAGLMNTHIAAVTITFTKENA
jgi:hypothetical protein